MRLLGSWVYEPLEVGEWPSSFLGNYGASFDHGAFGEIQSSGYGIKLKNPGGYVQELGDTGTDPFQRFEGSPDSVHPEWCFPSRDGNTELHWNHRSSIRRRRMLNRISIQSVVFRCQANVKKKPFTLKSSKIPYRMKCYAAMFYSNYIESIAGEPRASHSPLMTSLWTFRVDKVGFIRPPEK